MRTNFVVAAQKRADVGKGASRRLRRSEKVPAVIYGGGQAPESITVDHAKLIHMLENEAFYSSILTIDVDGTKSQAVLRALQRHAYKPKVLHMDLQRISATEKLHMHVPLHFKGEDVAPGVKAGGLVTHTLIDLEVSCLPKDLPEFIEVDLSSLELNAVLHIADIKLPEGVSSVALLQGHDNPVASIHLPRAAIEESNAAPVAPVTEVLNKGAEEEGAAKKPEGKK